MLSALGLFFDINLKFFQLIYHYLKNLGPYFSSANQFWEGILNPELQDNISKHGGVNSGERLGPPLWEVGGIKVNL